MVQSRQKPLAKIQQIYYNLIVKIEERLIRARPS